MSGESKICVSHLERKVCVYIRQSTQIQVQMHAESRRRQYDLRKRPLALGWREEQIVVIDEDLGRSASDADEVRAGYQRLMKEIVGGQVGAIVSVEMSRLARQDSEGHKLVEIAALMDTLLIDENQVYDPQRSDDRLMLGLKVLLSSNEIRLMRQRLQENRQRKAQRGELRLRLPVGLVNEGEGRIGLDPNEAVQGAVRQVFEIFRQRHCQSDVLRYFNENNLLFPRRRSSWDGPVEWRRLSVSRVKDILTNPLYAGAYVYGRSEHRVTLNTKGKLVSRYVEKPIEEWLIVKWDAFEGYISRKEYEANQRVLSSRPRRTKRRDGAALLSQIIYCGHCGNPMFTHYQGDGGGYVTYICCADQFHFAKERCQLVPGAGVDQCVAQRVLEVLTPAQIELSLAALSELEQQLANLHAHWQRQLEGAHYAANLAQRRYDLVEPENRLVSRQLEQRWERKLQEVARLEEEYRQFCQKQPSSLNEGQRQRLLDLVQDFPNLWHAGTTTWADRKNLLKLLVADVTVTRNPQHILVQIRWHTNHVETHKIAPPVRGKPKTPQVVVDRLRDLYQTHTDQQIADLLNWEGLRTAFGNIFNVYIVADTRRRNHLYKR